MTAVVGVDTRSRTMHWASSARLPLPVGDVGWLVEDRSLHQELARVELFWYSHRVFKTLPAGAHVFCEEPLALKNGETTRLLCLAAGAVWSGFQMANPDATWYWVNPATWKKAVLGRGLPPRGEKHKPWIEQTLLADPVFLEWMQTRPSTRGQFALQPDLYDAWCLMRYGTSVLKSLRAG